ncbi:hypothetical protein [Beihai hepe-like virus 4]|uniref:hypothetical protein n=1 Tax=Beihai hepe-like virus 4 TaxID=1922387 RepID=UPI00090BCA6D|nr:hypothetical protein [Beihai hepe-like virus 4]APG77598.1 hypothetical protein [Beihai hepe-like virus 4]
MEEASNAGGQVQATAHPSPATTVGSSKGPAGVYGPLTSVPVETSKIFFKHKIGTIKMDVATAPGTLLLSYVFNAVHDDITNARLSRFLQYKYVDLKLVAKRVDIAFARSGSILVVPSHDPFSGIDQTMVGKALTAALRSPASKTIAVSDQISFDMKACFSDTNDPFDWLYITTGNETVPSNMTVSCKVFILAQDAPQALTFSIPLYCEGTIEARGYALQIPKTLNFSQNIELNVEPELEFYPVTGDYALRYHQVLDIEDTAGHVYVIDENLHKIVIEDDEGHKEFQNIVITQGAGAIVERNLVVFLPTGLIDRTQMANPKYVRGMPNNLRIALVTEVAEIKNDISHNGVKLSSMPRGVVAIDYDRQNNYVPTHVATTAYAYANGLGGERLVPTRPVADVLRGFAQ